MFLYFVPRIHQSRADFLPKCCSLFCSLFVNWKLPLCGWAGFWCVQVKNEDMSGSGWSIWPFIVTSFFYRKNVVNRNKINWERPPHGITHSQKIVCSPRCCGSQFLRPFPWLHLQQPPKWLLGVDRHVVTQSLTQPFTHSFSYKIHTHWPAIDSYSSCGFVKVRLDALNDLVLNPT